MLQIIDKGRNMNQSTKLIHNDGELLPSNTIGINLGSINTEIIIPGKGIVLSEPSVVVEHDGDVYVGDEALVMFEKYPITVQLIRPIRHGIIHSFLFTEIMLNYFIQKVNRKLDLADPTLIMAVPADITKVEVESIKVGAQSAGIKTIDFVYKPIIAATTSETSIGNEQIKLIIYIVEDSTECVLVKQSQVIKSKSTQLGSANMELAIINFLRKKYHLNIEKLEVERIRDSIGGSYACVQEIAVINGCDSETSLTKKVEVSIKDLYECLQDCRSRIITTVQNVLSPCISKLQPDHSATSVMLIGSGASLHELDKLISKETGLNVTVIEESSNAVTRGLEKILNGNQSTIMELKAAL